MAEIQMHFSSGADASKRIPIPAYCQSTAAAAARQFHQGLPGYQPTPLHEVKGLAQLAAVGQVWVKDEAGRFDLDAFKVLGASYAVARLLAHELQLDDAVGLSLAELAAQAQQQLGQLTLVTATDGNHGRAVAWAAQQLGQQAIVYLPQGAAASRVMAIEQLGAQAVVTDSNYDDAVRLAAQQAEANGWFLVQDTAGPGYTQIPTWIMQGYTTLAAEAWQQLQVQGVRPTHIFLQAGVGSMAAAVLGYFMDVLDERPPKVVIMEPERAACYYQSARRGDGLPHAVIGDLQTIMAGLSCGNLIRWPGRSFVTMRPPLPAVPMAWQLWACAF